MEFVIKNIQKSTTDLMRTIAYKPAYFQKSGEFSVVRPIGRNDYPRFHVYITESNPSISSGQMNVKNYIFSIHLDQKKPSYEGSHAHSGEYDSDVVEAESERIKQLLK